MNILNALEPLKKIKEFKRQEEIVLTIPYEIRHEFRRFVSDSCMDIRDGILTKVINVRAEMECDLEYAKSLIENMCVCPEEYDDVVYEIRSYLMQIIAKSENSMVEIGAEEVLTANYIKFVLEKEYMDSYLELHPQYNAHKDLLRDIFYAAIDGVAHTLESNYEYMHSMIDFFKKSLEMFRKN